MLPTQQPYPLPPPMQAPIPQPKITEITHTRNGAVKITYNNWFPLQSTYNQQYKTVVKGLQTKLKPLLQPGVRAMMQHHRMCCISVVLYFDCLCAFYKFAVDTYGAR